MRFRTMLGTSVSASGQRHTTPDEADEGPEDLALPCGSCSTKPLRFSVIGLFSAGPHRRILLCQGLPASFFVRHSVWLWC